MTSDDMILREERAQAEEQEQGLAADVRDLKAKLAAAETLLRNLLEEGGTQAHSLACQDRRGDGASARYARAQRLTACAGCEAEAFLRGEP